MRTLQIGRLRRFCICLCTSFLYLLPTTSYAKNWYQLCTPHFNILYSNPNSSLTVNKLANSLEFVYQPLRKSLLNTPLRKISLVMHSESTISNGHFQLGPRRMVLWNFPSPDPYFIGNMDWLTILAIHESRHRLQSDLLYHHMNKNFRDIVFFSGLIDLSIPVLFAEGDAVGTETALSKSGRGRIPRWELLYRVNLLERGVFSYQKNAFGSYKDQVPSHYLVGYYMTTHLRRKYGINVIGNIYKETTNYFFPFFPFPIAIKKVTGRSLLQIHQDANQEILTYWKKQLENLPITPAKKITTKKGGNYTDYCYPQVTRQGHIVVHKSGIGTVPHFSLLNPSSRLGVGTTTTPTPYQEQKLYTPGHTTTNHFSLSMGKIVWVAQKVDKWVGYRQITENKKQHTAIQLYDITTKKHQQLTSNSRYTIAALCPHAKKIVAVESSTLYAHRLVILSATTGKILASIPNPHNYYYLNPTWSDDGKYIVATRTEAQKSTIVRINAVTMVEEVIYPISEEHISHPKIYKNYLFYNSAYSGIDNIYAMNLHTQERFQVTSRKYGGYDATISPDGKWIIYSDFSKEGMEVVKIPLNPIQWRPLQKVKDRSVKYYAPLVQSEKNSEVLLKDTPHTTYPTHPYQPWRHRPHLAKYGFEPSDIPLGLNFAVMSEDLLDGMHMELRYQHALTAKENPFEQQLSLNCSYTGWYPKITLQGSLDSHQHNFKLPLISNKVYVQPTLKSLFLDISYPIYLEYGQFTTIFSLGTCSILAFLKENKEFRQATTLSWQNRSQKSSRDIHEPWIQKITLEYGFTPFQVGNIQGRHCVLNTAFYFPALIKHHSIAYKYRYLYKSGTKITRPLIAKEAVPHIHELTYIFPLCYPDWHIGLLCYLQRIHTNISWIYKYLNKQTREHIVQGGLSASFHILGLQPKCKGGIAYTYNFTTKAGNLSPSFSIGL